MQILDTGTMYTGVGQCKIKEKRENFPTLKFIGAELLAPCHYVTGYAGSQNGLPPRKKHHNAPTLAGRRRLDTFCTRKHQQNDIIAHTFIGPSAARCLRLTSINRHNTSARSADHCEV